MMERSSFGAFAKRHRLALSLFAIVAASAVILPACGGNPIDSLDPPPTSGVAASMTISVTSSPASGTVLVGVTRQYAVEVRDQNNVIMTGATATWSLSGTAGVATITAAGGLTTCTAAGTITVLATGPVNQAGTNLTANATLECVAPPVPVATTMTVLVTSTPSTGTVLVGITRQYAVDVRDQNNAAIGGATAAWSIVGPAGVAGISAAGLATCLSAGTVTVHAIGPLNGIGTALTGDVGLTCAPVPLVPTTMTVLVTSSPATGTVYVAATRQYAVDVRDQNGAAIVGSTAAWSIVGPAGVAGISTNGLATCLSTGTVTVHAIGPLNGSGVALTGDVSLQCVPVPPVPTTMVILVTSAPTSGTIPVGATRQYAIQVRDQYNAVMAAYTSAAWSIVGTAGVAGIGAGTGLATCTAPGTVTPQAVGPLNGSGVALVASTELICVASAGNPATAVVLTPSTLTLSVGAGGGTSGTVTASFTDIDGRVTTNGCTIGFSIDDPHIATGSSVGLVLTVTAQKGGTTPMHATCTSAGTYSVSGTIVVR